MIAALFSAALLATIQTGAAPTRGVEEVIVTGRSLESTRNRLAECLQRRCPPAEDIAASVAHAENAFVAGEYKEARGTLTASLGRNRRHAKSLPVEVSGLERANGRVAAHLGESNAYYNSTWGIRRALKAGLPRTDQRLIAADLEIGDMMLAVGRSQAARQLYEGAAKDAARLGNRDLAARARVRGAWLEYLLENETDARIILRRLIADRDPEVRTARLAAMLITARLDKRENKSIDVDALVREVTSFGFERPVLVWAPPIEIGRQSPVQSDGEAGNVLRLSPALGYKERWIDLGFWVEPNGSVRDVDILRASGTTDWTDGLLRSAAGRRYSPTREGAYRIERYTYTAFWEMATGTRIRQRSPNARIEYFDLTAEPQVAAR